MTDFCEEWSYVARRDNRPVDLFKKGRGMTPEELERRRSFVGASETALLFGLPSFGKKTVSDLWFEKKYGVEKSSNGNASTKLGLRLEAAVLEAAEERLGCPIVDRQLWLTRDCNGATLDGRVDDRVIVEAKTSGLLGPSTMAQWGDDESDEVPDSYLLQVQAQLLVSGAELAYLAALIGGRGFAMFTITPQPELQAAIAAKAAEFIDSLAGDVAPPEPPQLDTLKRIRRQPNKVVAISDDLKERFDEAKSNAKIAEETKELIQREILAALGDAEAGECSGGRFTYFQQTNKYQAKPASETTFRVLRFAKG